MSPALHSVLIHRSKWLVLCWLALAGSVCLATESRSLVVASKRFTESYLLAEIISQTLEVKASARVERKPGLGNTAILFGALQQGKIDVYPEYVGTITKEILKEEKKRGTTIFFSSHLLQDMEELCTHLCAIHHGQMIYNGVLSKFLLEYKNLEVAFQAHKEATR